MQKEQHILPSYATILLTAIIVLQIEYKISSEHSNIVMGTHVVAAKLTMELVSEAYSSVVWGSPPTMPAWKRLGKKNRKPLRK
eukprot:scaffold273739_cov28-Prasinocladus_malaysianus.AAC.2